MARKIALTILALVACLVLARLFVLREPTHKGKTWSWWLAVNAYSPRDSAAKADAAQAICEIGTNLIPRLLAGLHDRSSMKWRLIRLLNRQSLLNLNLPNRSDQLRLAASGFNALGPIAEPAVPELIALFNVEPGVAVRAVAEVRGTNAIPVLTNALMTHTNALVRGQAALALSLFLFPSETLRPTLPLLTNALNDPDLFVQRQAKTLIAIITDRQPKNQIPALTNALTHTNSWVRGYAVAHLDDFPSETLRPALPLLTNALNDPDASIRAGAAALIRKITSDLQSTHSAK